MSHNDLNAATSSLLSLSERAQSVMRSVVAQYMETGSTVSSRFISKLPGFELSSASIRSVMLDLEEAGLLYAPHTSAGRMPTEAGLRLFVEGLLEQNNLSDDDRSDIEVQCQVAGRSVDAVLADASGVLSGLSSCVGLVVAPTVEEPIRHIEFVPLSPGRALVVLVFEGGHVENRLLELPLGVGSDALIRAGNFLSARLAGKTLDQARSSISAEVNSNRAEIDRLTASIVEAGLATPGKDAKDGVLIVRGQSNLLKDVRQLEELHKVQTLFQALETKETMLKLLESTDTAEGVQIFIGEQTELFGLSGCSMILAPYQNQSNQVVGAVGVIGPMHMNYGRIIPMVDYTAQIVSRALGNAPT